MSLKFLKFRSEVILILPLSSPLRLKHNQELTIMLPFFLSLEVYKLDMDGGLERILVRGGKGSLSRT